MDELMWLRKRLDIVTYRRKRRSKTTTKRRRIKENW